MALVQYDFGSSDSDSANEDAETTEVTKPVERQPQKRPIKTAETGVNDKDIQISKKIKIAIPKILDDKIDDDEADEIIPKVNTLINSNATCGLLIKLPAPKNIPAKRITTTSFVPHTLTRKTVPITQSKVTKAKLLAAKAKAANKIKTDASASTLNDKIDDSDDDDDIASISTNFDEDIWSQICGRPKKAKITEPVVSFVEPESIQETNEPEGPVMKLDNAAFKQLVGSSKRRQQSASDVIITDIVEADILEKTDVWMRKSLTDPQYQQKKTEEDDSTNPVAKNKHHITFLAHQAKAKEQELQAQWASGNQKRQMSRAKYGF